MENKKIMIAILRDGKGKLLGFGKCKYADEKEINELANELTKTLIKDNEERYFINKRVKQLELEIKLLKGELDEDTYKKEIDSL